MNNKIVLLITIIVFVLSCKPSIKQQLQTSLPTLEILSPIDGQVFEPEAPINLELLTDIFFDENSTDINKGYVKLTLDDKNVILLTQKNYKFSNIKPGTHELLVELFHPTNISYDVSKEITFKLKPREAIINILSPKNNFITNKTSIDIKLSLENLDLKNEGYIVLTLNDQVNNINELEYKFTNLKPGDYNLRVKPYRNDRSSAGDEKSISFKIEGTPPEGLNFDIWWPKENSNIEGDVTILRIIPSDNFLFGKENSSNKINEGHFHLFVNNSKNYIELVQPTFRLSDLSAGKNTIIVEMVNNDHTNYYLKKTVTFNAQTVTGATP